VNHVENSDLFLFYAINYNVAAGVDAPQAFAYVIAAAAKAWML
jgi:hypothetical protein